MKKILLTVTLAATSLFSFAQTPAVPNGGFETWTTSPCGEKPDDYFTAAELYNSFFNSCPSDAGVTKSTDKYSGTYALKLTAFGFQGSSSNSIYLSSSVDDYGVSFNGRPTKLVGYTKFTKGGTDVLNIGVELDDANGNEVAYNEVNISTTQSGYTKFEITLEYGTSNTNDVSSLIIFINLGNASDKASASSIALIDALSFEYGTATSTVNYSSKSPINVFAANNSINFSENVSDVHVTDMLGASKIQEAASTKTMNTASLISGLYIVTYNYNGNYFSKKVVIE
ncbi:T9SS type A sorting domain-containing protein [Cytophaga hutchinsonii]|uniref:Secretion system C-terminal sorting domain-containing protein n=1 Tax=Cytophaga hutchinsonii (strain ATCC 33406 / DSM 1761 / CIP 103989 / NBRC 15051 / NCIMB 9469 / D465) TaxID=269798 RepID=A0A6N4SNE1_CYTH3|nr:T9SS type A sorting domain-containing protein [Cytophaga hutchinsonii]ABG57770.1 hypothetical protein CHU_0481 [Cytophaga hutchinsonii ATCC 33406]SFX05063.1 Por secretion system C-terminal sorting domain-containing protein [Cytophaga hutchinsonii ATCC 33406]